MVLSSSSSTYSLKRSRVKAGGLNSDALSEDIAMFVMSECECPSEQLICWATVF